MHRREQGPRTTGTPADTNHDLDQKAEATLAPSGVEVVERRRLELAWRRFYGPMTTTEMRRVGAPILGEERRGCGCDACRRRSAASRRRCA